MGSNPDLTDRVEQLAERIEELEAENERLCDDVDELEEQNAELQKRVDILESRADANASGVDRLEERLEDGDLADETSQPERGPTVTAVTPLEQTVDLPEDVAESQLTENQYRARFVATDVRQYATRAPKGYTIDAGELGRVLAAGTNTEKHSETIRRVMNALDQLGKDNVDVVKRRGVKRVVFDEEIVQRLERITGETHDVVTRAEG